MTDACKRAIFPIRNMKTIHDTRQLGAAIRAERKRLGVTQRELAMTAGTGVRFVVELEGGKETARIGSILRILQVLGITVQLDLPDNAPGDNTP